MQVAVFGEAIWDLFPRRAGDDVATRAIDVRHPGGAPANVARTLARLGVHTSLVTAVGDDALGVGLVARLVDAGVRVGSVMKLPARTGVTFVDVREDGARSFLFYRHPSADMMIEPRAVTAAMIDARWLHLGTSTLARSPSREATRRALTLARRAGARVSLDVNARRHLWPSAEALRKEVTPLMRSADVVKLSEDDLVALDAPATVEGARTLHRARTRKNEAAVTVLTLAERGAVGFWGSVEVVVPTTRARVVDVTGAGDAFTAGLLATLIAHEFKGRTTRDREAVLTRALQIGCLLGTRAVTRLGATSALERLDDVARALRPIAPRPRATDR